MSSEGSRGSSDAAASSPATLPSTDQVRGNLGSTLTDQQLRQRRRERRPRYRAPFFPGAAQPEIIRANQKDLYYLSQLTDQLEEVVRNVFGTRWLQNHVGEVALVGRLAYFGLTTLLGTQTLGEEYVDILQYDSRTRKVPTLASRALLLSSHILAPYFLAKTYTRLRQYFSDRNARLLLQSQSSSQVPSGLFHDLSVNDPDGERHLLNEAEPLFADESPENDGDDGSMPDEGVLQPASRTPPSTSPPRPTRSFLRLPLSSLLASSSAALANLPSFETLLDEHVRSVHLAIFYLFGRYYHLAKRLLRIRYLSLQSSSQQALSGDGDSSSAAPRPPSYEVLGVLMAVQLLVRLISTVVRKRREARLAAQAERKAREKVQGTGSGEDRPQELEYVRPKATVDGVQVTDLVFDPDAVDDDEEDEQAGTMGYGGSGDDEIPQARRCTLCLGKRKDPAATECGHCFCFECIVGWVREKPECPLCRQKVNLSRILPLYNI